MYLEWSSMIWKCLGWWCESRCQSTAWCSAAAWWRPAWCPAPPPPRRWGGAWLAPAPARRPATRPPPGGGAARGAACSVLQTCRRCFTIGYTHTHNALPLDRWYGLSLCWMYFKGSLRQSVEIFVDRFSMSCPLRTLTWLVKHRLLH